MSSTIADEPSAQIQSSSGSNDAGAAATRLFAWTIIAVIAAYLINNFLIFWGDYPALIALPGSLDGGLPGFVTPLIYVAALLGAFAATRDGINVAFWAVGLTLAGGIGGYLAHTFAPDAGLATPILVVATAAAIARFGFAAFAGPAYGRSLRDDADAMHRLNLFIVRAAFWSVLLIGFVDAAISFMRVEGFLPALGAQLAALQGLSGEAAVAYGDGVATDLGRSQFRGPMVHLPLVAIGVLLATVTRTLGFQWLTLCVVAAELFIVIGRFVFSYEQTFMSDLVRFWYAALFLFASAYTLYEDGHVRVDILYAGFSDVTKGWINAIGCLVMGGLLCGAILIIGLGSKNSIVNGALQSFETSQSGFGMYIKYWMASFLAVFGVTMMIQFLSYFVESVADIRREPGKRVLASEAAH